MEITYVVKCPHCDNQQAPSLESTTGGEVQCEACEKQFWIGVSGDNIIHSHENSESVDRFFDLLKKNPDPYSQYDCPYCGKKLVVKNYFRNLWRVIDNNCHKIIFIQVGYNKVLKISKLEKKETTIFSGDFEKEVESKKTDAENN